MTPVKLPARSGWLCGDCATWYRWRHQVRDCCSEDDGFSRAEYAGALLIMLCVGFFLGVWLPHLA
jgi:hypothetical protein